jgi:hypothetical protein
MGNGGQQAGAHTSTPLRLALPSRWEVRVLAGRVVSTRPAEYPTCGVPPATVR